MFMIVIEYWEWEGGWCYPLFFFPHQSQVSVNKNTGAMLLWRERKKHVTLQTLSINGQKLLSKSVWIKEQFTKNGVSVTLAYKLHTCTCIQHKKQIKQKPHHNNWGFYVQSNCNIVYCYLNLFLFHDFASLTIFTKFFFFSCYAYLISQSSI